MKVLIKLLIFRRLYDRSGWRRGQKHKDYAYSWRHFSEIIGSTLMQAIVFVPSAYESRLRRALGDKTPNEFANEIAGSRDLIGIQTAENSPWGWYKKPGRSSDVDCLIRRGTKTRAGQTRQNSVACSSGIHESDAADERYATENWRRRIGLMRHEGPKHESYRRHIVNEQNDSQDDQSEPDN